MRKDETMENNNLMIFKNPEFGQVRSLAINGEPWLIGKDVAVALGYAKPQNAIMTHVDDEDKTSALIQGTGSNYKSKAIIINESGVYSLILSSKLPEAKRFKRWVTSEILPSIRKHGAYVTDKVLDQMDEHPEWIPEYIQKLREENASARATREALDKAQAENALLAPKAHYYDSFIGIESLTNLRYTAKELGVPQKKFIGYLLEKGYVFRDRHRKGRVFVRAGKRNDPLFKTRDFYLPDGTKSEYTLVTPAGKAHFLRIAEKIRTWEPGYSNESEDISDQAIFARQ